MVWAGLWVRSWSINCPICMTKTVWVSSVFVLRMFSTSATVVLIFLADSNSEPSIDFVLGNCLLSVIYRSSECIWDEKESLYFLFFTTPHK